MNDIIDFIEKAVLIGLVGFSAILHLADIADRFFGRPAVLVNLIRGKRRADIREALDELGISAPERAELRSAIQSQLIAKHARYTDPFGRCLLLLKSCTVRGPADVGTSERVPFPYYADVMSLSLQPDRAEEGAYIIASHLRSQRVDHSYDCIIGLKRGSPLLASAVAQKFGRPLVLFRGPDDYKKDRSARNPRNLFDGVVARGMNAVIVDDSTTGGKHVLDCIAAAHDLGIRVDQCWVLFEPLGKGAKAKLEAAGVRLISVVQMNDQVVDELLKGI